MKKPINLGTRKFEIYNAAVEFDSTSTIKFFDKKTEELILQLDPTELSAIYWSYIGMLKEENEEYNEIPNMPSVRVK